MKKKWVSILSTVLIFAIFLQQGAVFAGLTLVYDGQAHDYQGSFVSLYVGGQSIACDVPPIILENRTLLPLRAALEPLGAQLSFVPETQKITAVLGDYMLELTVNSKTALLNGRQTLTMDVPAKIINDRTFIPLRFVAESLGLQVGWDGNTCTASVDIPPGGLPKIEKSNLTSIQVARGGKNVDVILGADRPFGDYTVFSLDNPQRLVIDVYNTLRSLDVSNITTEDALVSAVRSSQYQQVPAVTRVVMDLSRQSAYEITKSSDGKILTISFDTEGSIPLPTPTPDVSGIPALSEKARNKLVVVDPGHGGSDPGAIGYDSEGNIIVTEAAVNLDVGLRLNALLQAAGVQTKMTRDTDVLVPLMDIPKIANDANADLFISVHCNSLLTAPTANGTETLYFSEETNPAYGISGIRFAQLAQKELISVLGTTDRGLKHRPNLVVLKYTKMPAVLAEMAFISNEKDREKLMSEAYKDKVARALCKAVILALNESVGD